MLTLTPVSLKLSFTKNLFLLNILKDFVMGDLE